MRVLAHVLVLALIASLMVCPSPLLAQQSEDSAEINARVVRLYREGRYEEAIPVAERALALREKTLGPDHPDVGTLLNNLAALYRVLGRLGEAEPLYRRSLAIADKALGPDHHSVGISLNNLARLLRALGRYGEAEPLYRRTIAIFEKRLGPAHTSVGTALNNLAGLYQAQGRYAEAEPLYKRTIAIFEMRVGSEHPDVASVINNLATLYEAQGRYSESESLLLRSLAIREKALRSGHPDIGTSLNNLAALYRAQGRTAEAEPLYRRSLAISEKALGSSHPSTARTLNNLAVICKSLGRFSEAESLYKRALEIRERTLGSDHRLVASTLVSLAELFRVQGRTGDAEPLLMRALGIWEVGLGTDHLDVGTALNNIAWVALTRGDIARASNFWRRAMNLLRRRAERGLVVSTEGSAKGDAQRYSWYFDGFIKASHRLFVERRGDAKQFASDTFVAAQWARSLDAAGSLSQMAVRSAKGSPELATLARERQDLVAEWQARDKLRIAAFSKPPNQRSPQGEVENASRLAAIDRRLAEIDARFSRDFPDYAALVQPRPVAFRDVQAVLGEHEALILFLDTDDRFEPALPTETFVWVVTKTDMRWLRSDLGAKALEGHVGALRCGLDAASWRGEGEARCQKLLGTTFSRADIAAEKPLPFDLARAHALYKGLLGEAESLLRNPDGSWKEMIVVPSGALTQLPFQVLVTAPPKARFAEMATDLAAVSWLGRRQAITVLPAVSSLRALRRDAKPSLAKRPYIGFGNPTLLGRASVAADQAMRPLAEAWQSCTNPEMRAGCKANFPRITSGRAQDVGKIREWSPLPQTACELCAVGRGLPEVTLSRDIRLGRAATERIVRLLGEIAPGAQRSTLQDYRIIHFATHGMVADVKKGYPEPGLILTPPEGQPSEEDDGYLSASEITTLKLDADWVILSACNTAAGTSETTEALSGLARAFFYAGARALLVSNWEVYTN
ncbi:MAG: tetratricopeptide repeat protein, partial [Hyphomicrobiaceae bacterium]